MELYYMVCNGKIDSNHPDTKFKTSVLLNTTENTTMRISAYMYFYMQFKINLKYT